MNRKEISYLEKRRMEKLCPKCLSQKIEVEMEYKGELGEQDFESDYSPPQLRQCPICKNIEIIP